MRSKTAARWVLILPSVIMAAHATAAPGSLPPGRQHVLTIEGQNTVRFRDAVGLGPLQIDYRARVEYIVNTREKVEADTKAVSSAKKKPARGTTAARSKARRNDGDETAVDIVAAVDVSVHSTEMKFQQNGQTVVESRASRNRFQGRFLPDAPVLSVSYNQAPPVLQEFLRRFDTPAASVFLDDRARVVRRVVRMEGALHAIVETLLSIHTPIPTDVAFWEAPTQLAMGHGQTAKGMLRFEKVKEAGVKTSGLVNVKVSGVLKAEGTVAGTLIKHGTYTVTGEQVYDARTREWTSARWSVDVDNELANANAVTVAQARGNMIVQSTMLDAPVASDVDVPKSQP
jgi:hypothetical protein